VALDIIEIALDSITDHAAFEMLASELMRDEGYPGVKPLGGVADRGRDAVEERFYTDGKGETTVFQYTLQEYISGKLVETVEKLKKERVEYQELVIVTPNRLSTELQDKLVRTARKEHKIALRVFERKTIVNRLADYSNGIFHRYFPDIQRQVADLVAARARRNATPAGDREAELLKVSAVFSFSREGRRARKSVFDNIILALVLSTESHSVELSELSLLYAKQVGGIAPPADQVRASLARLDKDGLVRFHNQRVERTTEALSSIEGGAIRATGLTESVLSDVLDTVATSSGRRLSRQETGQLRVNARKVLVEMFRLFGLEVANQIVGADKRASVYLRASDELFRTANDRVDPKLGTILMAALGELFRAPTPEQAEVLEAWSLAYLGTAVMNLDPLLAEFQATRLRGKMFIVDTDIILEAAVLDTQTSVPLRALLQALIRLGCRVVLPETCIDECVNHAAIAHRTYHYFEETLLLLNDAAVDDRVGNVFVKGYYYARSRGTISPRTTFPAYLANYYEGRSGNAFFREVLKENLPEGVEFAGLSALYPETLPEAELRSYAQVLYDRMQRAKKAQYRTNEENLEFARNDAALFLTALYLNAEIPNKVHSALGGRCYLITGSSRYMRSAGDAGLRDPVTTRPQILVGLLDLVGQAPASAEEFVRLFENPFLIHAVSESWDDIQALVRAGIDIQGKSLTRLRWDLDAALHESIAAVTAVDESETEQPEPNEVQPRPEDDEFLTLIRTAAARGYRLIPEAQSLVDTVEASRQAVRVEVSAYTELLEKYEQLEAAISGFGKRKRRYLERLARQQAAHARKPQ
jgi:hypothetical protein